MKKTLLILFLATLAVLGYFKINRLLAINAVDVNNQDSLLKPRTFPYQFIISDQQGGESRCFGESRSKTVEQIASDLDCLLYPEDRVSLFPGINYRMGSTISVLRAPEVFVIDGTKASEYRSFSPTVGDFLDQQGIIIGDDDRLNFGRQSKIVDQIEIRILRVAITNITERKLIDYKTITREDPNLDEGKTRIEQAGKTGTLEYVYRVTRENGVEKDRTLISKKTTVEPVSEIIYKGTRPVITVSCRFNGTVIAAAIKYNYSANKICNLMMLESRGNQNSVSSNGHYGLFQYTSGSWEAVSDAAGYGGADIFDSTAQIYSTAWALTHGQSWRW